MPKECGLLLKINVDSAIEYLMQTNIRFISTNRCVCWNEGNLMTFLDQRGRDSVVMHARAAVHSGSARSNIGNPHYSSDLLPVRKKAIYFRLAWTFLTLQLRTERIFR